MPLAGKIAPPTGTVSFYNVLDPKDGKPREYNLTEVFDILNENFDLSTNDQFCRITKFLYSN